MKPFSSTIPLIKMDKQNRLHVIKLLNDISIENVKEALRLLWNSEPGPESAASMEVVVGQNVAKCSRTNRACTNGRTLWISLSMFEGENAPTEHEIGFKLPRVVKPGTIVILHEFAHLLMGHPYDPVTTKDNKERIVDTWAKKFVEPFNDDDE